MVVITYSEGFKQAVRKLDPSLKEKVKKQMMKILDNPEVGKPMHYERKGTREVRIAPCRLAYAYFKEEEKIIFLDIYHKDEQ